MYVTTLKRVCALMRRAAENRTVWSLEYVRVGDEQPAGDSLWWDGSDPRGRSEALIRCALAGEPFGVGMGRVDLSHNARTIRSAEGAACAGARDGTTFAQPIISSATRHVMRRESYVPLQSCLSPWD